MFLYRYFGTHGLETLRDRMLKVSKVSSLNDPFECAYRITGTITLDSCKTWIRSRWDSPDFLQLLLDIKPELKSLKKAKRHLKANVAYWAAHFLGNREAVVNRLRETRETFMDRQMRVACFSSCIIDPAMEILLWAHYAQKHTGIRIGFEFPVNEQRYHIEPMIYQIERAGFDVSNHPLSDPDQTQMRKIMRTKSMVWRYEDEFRLITAATLCHQNPPPNNAMDFLPFDSAWVKRIDFGLRHNVSMRDKIMGALLAQYPHASWFQADYHDDDFALKYRSLQPGRSQEDDAKS